MGGDPPYASEYNKFAGISDYASGQTLSVSAGSSTAIGAWVWTTTGSVGAVTDDNLSTYWAGSWIGPVGQAGSIVISLPFEGHRNSCIFTGSIVREGTISQILRVYNSTGSSYNISSQAIGAGGLGIGSNYRINSRYKTKNFSVLCLGGAGSATVKLWDVKII